MENRISHVKKVNKSTDSVNSKAVKKDDFLDKPFFKDTELFDNLPPGTQLEDIRKELRRETIQEFRKKHREAGSKLQTAHRTIKSKDSKLSKMKEKMKEMEAQLAHSKKEKKALERQVSKKDQALKKYQEKDRMQSKKLLQYRASRNKLKKSKCSLKENFFAKQEKNEDVIKQLKSEIRDKDKHLTNLEQLNDALEKSEITVFQNGTYSDEIRICALELLEKGMSARDVVQVKRK